MTGGKLHLFKQHSRTFIKDKFETVPPTIKNVHTYHFKTCISEIEGGKMGSKLTSNFLLAPSKNVAYLIQCFLPPYWLFGLQLTQNIEQTADAHIKTETY